MPKYFSNIAETAKTLLTGLRATWPHLRTGHARHTHVGIENPTYFDRKNEAVTIQYPHETLPVPDVGRYRLDMEADDCIVCDKCARICPVDCIAIDGFKAVEDLGETSDGTKKRLELAVFDIDMAKCCFCGLCTTVCPTECLTMTKVYDYSETNRDNFNYHFGLLSPEVAEQKRALLPVKPAATPKSPLPETPATPVAQDAPPVAKPVFKPKIVMKKPAASDSASETHPE